jgi:uncharacterized membrane protein YfcA
VNIRGVTVAAAAFVVAFAACVQASVGFAYALLAAPMLALVSPDLVPGPVLVSSFALSALTALREHASVDWRGVGLALVGRLPGAVVAGSIVSLLPRASFELIFGSVVIVAVLVSALGKGVRATTPALLVAGFASGVMGTLTSVGGPPIALVYQHAQGPELRATLNAFFALGSLVSLAVLAGAGEFSREQALMGIAMLPAVAVGFACSAFTRDAIDRGRARSAVLALAAASSLAVMLRAAFW